MPDFDADPTISKRTLLKYFGACACGGAIGVADHVGEVRQPSPETHNQRISRPPLSAKIARGVLAGAVAAKAADHWGKPIEEWVVNTWSKIEFDDFD
jgi:hypothetical protein